MLAFRICDGQSSARNGLNQVVQPLGQLEFKPALSGISSINGL
jgi:hypothetical protein